MFTKIRIGSGLYQITESYGYVTILDTGHNIQIF